MFNATRVLPSSFQFNWMPNCLFWARSDLGITASSNAVSQWNDNSSGGYNLTQGTPSWAPVYGSGVHGIQKLTATGPGSIQYLVNTSFPTLTHPFTYIFVLTPTNATPSNNGYILDNNSGNNCATFITTNSNVEQYNGNIVNTTAISVNNIHLLESVFNDSSSGIAIDGAAYNAAAPGNPTDTLNIGITLFNYAPIHLFGFEGDIYEFIIIGRTLTSTERTRIHQYAQQRYSTS